MNTLVFTVWAGAQHGGALGPVAFQSANFGAATPPPPGGLVIQMQTLQMLPADTGGGG